MEAAIALRVSARAASARSWSSEFAKRVCAAGSHCRKVKALIFANRSSRVPDIFEKTATKLSLDIKGGAGGVWSTGAVGEGATSTCWPAQGMASGATRGKLQSTELCEGSSPWKRWRFIRNESSDGSACVCADSLPSSKASVATDRTLSA